MALLLYLIFFVSGVAGVVFETLWFRVAGLTLGNSQSASAIVLASFMAGLAVGNGIAARHGRRVRKPLVLYAALEGVVALIGVAIVVVLPPLSPAIGRMFAHLVSHGWLVDFLRLVLAFALMCVPATAMGLTLPLLAKARAPYDANFGRTLGRLYGCNTLGAMAGAVCGELWLIGRLGLTGTALAAGALNLLAAAGALLVARRTDPSTPRSEPERVRSTGTRSWRLLAAAALAGATLLALEVVWFRFLQLFVFGSSFIFAVMLAVVLLGIGAGGVIASYWLSWDLRAHRFAPLIALAAGIATEACYARFAPAVGGPVFSAGDFQAAFLLLLRLTLPTALLSGVLLVLLGAAQQNGSREDAEAAGELILANTLGGALGSLLAGFVLLPRLGMEKALFVSTLSYGFIACLTISVPKSGRLAVPGLLWRLAPLALFAVAVGLYPFGSMMQRFVPLVTERYKASTPELVALREGPTETAIYLRSRYHGQPLYHRLMTNGHSMSATTYRGRRYMKMYAYWGLAVNPGARKALLIGYGVGTTAEALTDSRQLESIDVVDLSTAILESASIAFPNRAPPLADPRMNVHVEDGRFFLQTTEQQFDLITSEPPPLRGAGVAHLYTREYFALMRDRLRRGGVVTYWLPVDELWPSETKAILAAFCQVFSDCSLWNGAGLQWMLAGTRGAHGPVPEARFSAQWRDPVVAPELAALGFESPEALGTTFLADAETLREWSRGVPPLDDDHPGRMLVNFPTAPTGDPIYRSWMDTTLVRTRFESSAYIRDLWPAAVRERSLGHFAEQAALDDLSVWNQNNSVETLHAVLTQSSLRTLPLLLMGTEPSVQRLALPLYANGARDSSVEFEMGAHAMSERDYEGATRHFGAVVDPQKWVHARLLRALALALLGRTTEADEGLRGVMRRTRSRSEAYSVTWLRSLVRASPAGDAPRP